MKVCAESSSSAPKPLGEKIFSYTLPPLSQKLKQKNFSAIEGKNRQKNYLLLGAEKGRFVHEQESDTRVAKIQFGDVIELRFSRENELFFLWFWWLLTLNSFSLIGIGNMPEQHMRETLLCVHFRMFHLLFTRGEAVRSRHTQCRSCCCCCWGGGPLLELTHVQFIRGVLKSCQIF